ncbi:MAG: hypothetical protein R2710_29055 [Acidimicrobiales bacterium]
MPEEVWRAIVTGPGISSWYVPHVVEERGWSGHRPFGPEPEMQIPAGYEEPLRRIVLTAATPTRGWRSSGWSRHATADRASCGWSTRDSPPARRDDHYNGMTEGWKSFLSNLQLHLAHFGGQTATAMLPMASWAGPPAEA